LPFDYLTEVTYPSTLKVVGEYCFRYCDLTEVVLPEGVERIERDAYRYNSYLTKIKFPSTLKFIGRGILSISPCDGENCDNQLKEVVIPKSVETIEGSFCYGRCGLSFILEDSANVKKFSEYWKDTGE